MTRDYGRKFFEAALQVPSGKLAIGNDFRDQYPGCPDFYVNEISGIKQTFEWYAKNGLLHGFVGNSCPGVFQDKERILIAIASDDCDDIPGTRISGICTDLWWYSIADLDDLVSRGGEPELIVDVAPGRYVIKHSIDANGWIDTPFTYATIAPSNESIEEWKLPEEGAAEELERLLPWDFTCKSTFLYIKSRYTEIKPRVYEPSNYRFDGHEIHGVFPRKKPPKEGSSRPNTILVELLVKSEELSDLPKVAARLLQEWEENHDDDLHWEKIKNSLRKKG